ncbi:MAG: tetratricopeptide repeat protein [Nodosilinea sp.]
MSAPYSDAEILAHNQTPLAELTRAISLRPDRFSLVLARCNYARLRTLVVNHLQATSPVVEWAIPPQVSTLRHALAIALPEPPPAALLITGLAEESDLVGLLKSANLGRDEFPKAFPFPLVLWVNDRTLQLLTRHAPDFKSFAAAPISFEYPPGELSHSLHQHAQNLFTTMLSLGDNSPHPGYALRYRKGSTLRTELEFALADIAQTHDSLDDELKATLDFLQGRDGLSRGEFDLARYYFEQSLDYWQARTAGEDSPVLGIRHRVAGAGLQGLDIGYQVLGAGYQVAGAGLQPPETQLANPSPPHSPLQPFTRSAELSARAPAEGPTSSASSPEPSKPAPLPPTPREKQAILLFYLGVTYRSWAVLQPMVYWQMLHIAQDYFAACLRIFEAEGRPDLVGKFLHPLAEVRQKLEDWPGLGKLAQAGLALHRGDPARLARDHGYLAEVALSQADPQTAEIEAQRALDILKIARAVGSEAELTDSFGLALADQYQRGWYLYLLAQVQVALGQVDTAISLLQEARRQTTPETDLSLYRRILETLRQQYYSQKDYRAAFHVKLAQRQVETYFRLRAFIGAGHIQPYESSLTREITGAAPARLATEITASGRQQDVDSLITRLEQARYPLVIIHGPSGVGKSSILYGGLAPALGRSFPEGRATVPVLVKDYRDWPDAINQALETALQHRGDLDDDAAPPAAAIGATMLLTRMKALIDQHYLQIVLIFDQFEEFFVEATDLPQRREFYSFFTTCLNARYLKVVLALREDYLHYLLEIEREFDLDILNDDILSREQRYYLGNLRADDVKRLIRHLTNEAHFYLEAPLINQLVKDLATETGLVRPIELQVVGAQLQRDGIDTLAAYRQLGPHPKETLVQRFLNAVIHDCGPENAPLARAVLFLLTDADREHRLYRPQKSREDLEADLTLGHIPYTADPFDLVLEILVGSGLVFMIPELPIDRYQLVHDYLVSYVRQEPPPAFRQKA